MKRRYLIRGLLTLLVGMLLLLSLWSYRPGDWPGWTFGRQLLDARNAFGFVGAVIAKLFVFLFGKLAIAILPPFFLLVGLADLIGRRRRPPLLAWTGAALLILLWGGSELVGGPQEARLGWFGLLLAEGLRSLTGETGSQIILVFLTLIGILAVLPSSWLDALQRLLVWLVSLLPPALGGVLRGTARVLAAVFGFFLALPRQLGTAWQAAARGLGAAWQSRPRRGDRPFEQEQARYEEDEELRLPSEEKGTAPAAARQEELAFAAEAAAGGRPRRAPATSEPRRRKPKSSSHRGGFELPDPSLLEAPVAVDSQADKRFLEERARILVDKLASFNIGGRVSAMSQGPVVTTYEFEPDTGVKVNQILSRREDLALALRSKELRMVAPIPGKAAVGVEVPNPKPRLIRLREVLDAGEYRGRKGDLALALGVDVDGHAFWADMAEMPHLLVAGATGTGKSICINSILISLLLAHTPESLKLFLIDPKMLELSVYNEIPHLLHPVITDNRIALQALNWLVGEMERRYQLLKPAGVRSIGEYNEKVLAGQVQDTEGETVEETLPFLVGVVEEFADLMMTLGKDIQAPLIRLAQMARAVGIHLILATQRPSVDIIDGVIKANFPSRIAFKVFSRFDSKTILDANGAETLIGRGDMLFKHGRQPFPVRLHGAYVSTPEVEQMVEYWREYDASVPQLELEQKAHDGSGFAASDELYDDAKQIVVLQGFGSTTMLQRRLRVGYTRASRLMDMLEEAGIVGPHTGSKAREVLVGPEVLEEDAP